VEKTNDADGDGVFSKSESAPVVGSPVTFQVVVSNTGTDPVTITEVTDEFGGQAPAAVCPSLIGTTLPPGGSVTCTFTLAGYAPPHTQSAVDTVRVVAEACVQPGCGNSATSTSTSTATTACGWVVPSARVPSSHTVSTGPGASAGGRSRRHLPGVDRPEHRR
jgi:hypothetical protein